LRPRTEARTTSWRRRVVEEGGVGVILRAPGKVIERNEQVRLPAIVMRTQTEWQSLGAAGCTHWRATKPKAWTWTDSEERHGIKEER
jgi:hypothetical protein